MTGRPDKDAYWPALMAMLGDVITLVGPLYLVKQRKWVGSDDEHTHAILMTCHRKDDLKDTTALSIMSKSCLSTWRRSFYINIVLGGSVMLARVTHHDILELKNWNKIEGPPSPG